MLDFEERSVESLRAKQAASVLVTTTFIYC